MYWVRSQTTEPEGYAVRQTARGWSCRCPDHQYRKAYCKHICAIRLLQGDTAASVPKTPGAGRNMVVVSPIETVPKGYIWRGAVDITKKGSHTVKYDRAGRVQRYGCKGSGRRFVFRPGFERMRHDPETVTEVLNQYPRTANPGAAPAPHCIATGPTLRTGPSLCVMQGSPITYCAPAHPNCT